MSEIAALCAQEFPIKIVAVIEEKISAGANSRLPFVPTLPMPEDADAIIVTDLDDPQRRFENAIKFFPKNRVLTPAFLGISRTPPTLEE